jgi:hypothetical protein
MMAMVALQLDTEAIEMLQRIAVAQMIMAGVMIIIGLIAMGAAIVGLLELRSARRLLHNLGDTVDELKPRLAPLIDRTIHLTSDLAGMTDNIRRKVDDMLFTMEELNRIARRGGSMAEERLDRFAAVVDIAQTEAEELLLDAAATARGVQETARQLRDAPGGRSSRRKPFDTPIDDDEIEEMFE